MLPVRAPAPPRSLAQLTQFAIPGGDGDEDEELDDAHVCKVLPGNGNRVYSIGWLPVSHKLIGVVGGRWGHLSLLLPDEHAPLRARGARAQQPQ